MIGSEYHKDVAVFHPHDDKRPAWKNDWVSVSSVSIEDLEKSRLDDEILAKPSGALITWAEYLRLKQLRY